MSAPALPEVLVTGDSKVFQFPTPEKAAEFAASAEAAGGEVIRMEPKLPAPARPLYDLELHLAALLDTEDGGIPAELEQEYALELHATLIAAEEKRDRVAQFRRHLQAQIAFAKEEVTRLRDRQTHYEGALEHLDSYITRVIDMLGTDSKGKRRKLEGNVATIGLHGCDRSVEVTDETAVPALYKRVTITLPLETWETLMDSIDLDLRESTLAAVTSPAIEVSKSAVKADLKAGVEIAGARLAGGTYVEVK